MEWREWLKRIGTMMIAVSIAATAVEAGENRWTPIRIEGISVRSFVVSEGAYFASANNGDMFVLEAGAEPWRRLAGQTNTSRAAEPSRVEVVGDDFMLASGGLGLFRSVDRGRSWRRVLESRSVGAVARDASSEAIFAVSHSGALSTPDLMRSDDSGSTWRVVGPIPTARISPRIGQLAVRGNLAVFSQITPLGSATTSRSVDGGLSFDVNSGRPSSNGQVPIRRIDALRPGLHYQWGAADVSPNLGCLHRSEDSGRTWMRTSSCFDLDLVDMAVDPSRSGRLLLSLGTAIIEVLDRGDRWSMVPMPELGPLQRIGVVAAGLDQGTIIASREAEDAILITRDLGSTWQAFRAGLEAIEAESVEFGADGRIIVGTTRGMYTVDNGDVVQRQTGSLQVFNLSVEPFVARFVQAAARSALPLLTRSEDGASTWTDRGFSNIVTIARHGRETAIFRGFNELERSLDGGETFETMLAFEDIFALSLLGPVQAMANPSPDRMHVALSAGIANSYDGGRTWGRGTAQSLQDVDRIWNDPFDLDHLLARRSLGRVVLESEDGGRSWQAFAPDYVALTSVFDFAFDPVVPDRLFAAGVEGVEVSRDGGRTWASMNEGFDRRFTWALAIDPRRPTELVAGTARGPYVYSLLEPCVPNPTTLCIDDQPRDGRFAVRLRFDTALGGGRAGASPPISLSSLGVDRGGLLHFGNPSNPEVLVKVLDGCGINGHYWVFASAATTLGYELLVHDRFSGTYRSYRNPDQAPAATVSDTQAFATCDASPSNALTPPTSSSFVTEVAIADGVGAASPPSLSERGLDGTMGTCVADATTLCIDGTPGDQRFRVRMRFRSDQGGADAGTGVEGDAGALDLGDLAVARGGLLHFGNPRNPEVLIKVLDGCTANGRFWVFASAATTLGFDLTVEDTVGGEAQTYSNADGNAASAIADTQAFASCDAS